MNMGSLIAPKLFMASLLLITGNHPRHFYLAGCLSKSHDIVGWIIDIGFLLIKFLIGSSQLSVT